MVSSMSVVKVTILLISTSINSISSFSIITIPSSRRRLSQTKTCVGSYATSPRNIPPIEEPDYYLPSTHNPFDEMKKTNRADNGNIFSYNSKNIESSANTFHAIRSIGGVECTNDVYARQRQEDDGSIDASKQRNHYWYIGKIARCDGIMSLEQAMAAMYPLMEEHAARLRPVELGRLYGSIELYVSKKGDTEWHMNVSNAALMATADTSAKDYDESMDLMKMDRKIQGSNDVKPKKEVGFLAEYVTNKGQGFFIVRDNNGKVMF